MFILSLLLHCALITTSMTALCFPKYTFRIKTEGKHQMIFDDIRKKWLVLTPEEWVRQHMLRYLAEDKKYPASLMAIEMGIKLNGTKKRCDIAMYNTKGEAIALVECKAPSVKITQAAFDQIARYNMELNVKYLIVSNGLKHYCCVIDFENKSYEFLNGIPEYHSL